MRTDRYKGQIVLPEISIEGQRAIGRSKIAVVGLGGTGSMAAELFSRLGVGSVSLIDGDSVRESNLQRQILYSEADLGRLKAEAAADRLESENSDMIISTFSQFLDDSNSATLLEGASLIYDGTDNVMARHCINREAVRTGRPWVMSSAIEYYGQVKAVIPGQTSCLSCMNYPLEEATVSCSEQGIFPPVLAWVTSIGVSIAIDILLGKQVNGDFIHLDMRSMEMKKFAAERNRDCKVCSANQR